MKDLSGDIGRTVVATADIDRATVAGRAGALRKQIDFHEAVGPRFDLICGGVPAIVVGAAVGDKTIPCLQIEGIRQNAQVRAIAWRLESLDVADDPGNRVGSCNACPLSPKIRAKK